MSLEVTQEFITRRVVAEARAERRKDRESNKSRLRTLPGWLPVARRERCRHCGNPLPLYVYSQQRARYGWQGYGVFCKQSCGYWYGFRAAGGVL